jgi:hypothetical protein
MSLLGKSIKVAGISQRGKNRVREFGDTWVVLAETDRILFSPTEAGPWLFIAPPGMGQEDRASRWMHIQNDPTFEVVRVLDT